MKLKIILLITFMSASVMAKKESWYLGLAIGGSNPSYSDEIQSNFKSFEDTYDEDDIESKSKSAGELSFLWPIMESSLLGIGYTWGGQSYEAEDGTIITSAFGIFGISAQFYSGDEPGDGFFLRADFGNSVHSFTQEWDNDPTRDVNEVERGSAYLAGLGYAFPIGRGDETRILIGANYSKMGKDLLAVENTSIYLGFLF